MANQPAAGEGGPRRELARSRGLARQVRRAQRATWFPLLVFAVLTFAAVLVTRTGHPSGVRCRAVPQAGPGGRVCIAHNSVTFVYWPIALVLAYVAIAAFYVHRSRARGIGTRIRPYVIAGIAIAVALTGVSIWAAHHGPLVGEYDVLGWHLMGDDVYRLIGPACAIGLALLVLAAVERSLALLAITAVYLWVALAPINFGWTVHGPSHWIFLPYLVIQGSVLLAAALGFAAAQRGARPASV
jgi:hypothetical protein